MIDWLPDARRTLTFPGVGSYLDGNWKIVLHSTEGGTVAGALATYAKTQSYPHLTIGPDRIEQHCSFLVAASALQNLAGGVQTNRSRTIQIEIVGYAASIGALPQATIDNVRKALEVLIAEFPIDTNDIPEFRPYPASYGNSGVRFSAARWNSFKGICGHMHVPENMHGDPGALNVQLLLNAPAGPVTIETTHVFEGDNVRLERKLIDVPRLDKDGNGYVDIDVPVERLVSLIKVGPAPNRDGGYENSGWPDFELKVNNTGGIPRVSIESDVPFGHVSFYAWVVVS